MVAACTVAILPFATRPLFDAATGAFADLSAGAFIASFVGTLLMFAHPDHVPRRRRAVGHPAGGDGRARGRHRRRAPLRALDRGLDRRHLPAGADPDPGDRHAPHAAVCAALARALRGAAAAAPRPAGAPAVLAAPAFAAVGPDQAAATACSTRASRRTSSSRSSSATTGRACCSSTRAGPCTRSTPAEAVLTGGFWDAFLSLPLLTGRRPAACRPRQRRRHGRDRTARPGRETHVDGVEIDPVVTDGRAALLRPDEPAPTVDTADARFSARADGATTSSSSTPTASRTSRSTSPRASSSSWSRDRLGAGRRGLDQRRHAARR